MTSSLRMRPSDSNIIAGAAAPRTHPFIHAPNTTLIYMSLPVLLSLIAEPLTGLVDTAFVSRLGSISLAALGVGTVGLSGIFWIFNFLGIGTQLSLFDQDRSSQKRQRLNTALDSLYEKFGEKSIVPGTLLND